MRGGCRRPRSEICTCMDMTRGNSVGKQATNQSQSANYTLLKAEHVRRLLFKMTMFWRAMRLVIELKEQSSDLSITNCIQS